jgi:hypothetical protein
MAGDWIKIEKTTPDKPEIIRMATLLRKESDEIFGKIFRIWSWADDQSVDGTAMPITDEFIDKKAGKRGFAQAMRAVGWLRGEAGALEFPRFTRHNGETAKTRADTNRRVAKHRSRNAENVTSVTNPALEKPLPEKRREDKKSVRESASARDALIAEQIVNAYPRREKAKDALAIVLGHLAQGEDGEAMLSGTRAAAAVIRTLPSGPLNRYVPSAAAYFEAKRWADDPETMRRQGAAANGQGIMDLEEAKRQLGGRAMSLEA